MRLFNSIIGVLGREECVAIALIPKANRFPADYDTTFSQQIFNISMAETKSVVEPNRVTDDVGREPVPFVSIHPLILSIQRVNLAIPSIPRHQWVSFPLDYPIFLCATHTRLTGNVTFQDNLLHTLLSLDIDD